MASQRWIDLAFLHYRVDGSRLRSSLPDGLALQEFDGSAWISVVAFRLGDLKLRGLPDWCALRSFPELNVRTYVERDGKPGVWFFSLDAPRPLVVGTARLLYGIPYRWRDVRSESGDGWNRFSGGRHREGGGFSCGYRGDGIHQDIEAGSLEHWLLERYCLYSQDAFGRVVRVEIDHVPWEIEGLSVEGLALGDLLAAMPLLPRGGEPIFGHFSRGLPVVSWPGEVCGREVVR